MPAGVDVRSGGRRRYGALRAARHQRRRLLFDAAVKVFTDRIVARSAAVIALGKRAFYAQVDRPLSVAYEGTTEAMAWNLVDQDAFEGMDAFLEKRAAKWRSGF